MVKTWKDNELKFSKIFGTKRNPFSGSMSHQTKSDTLHEDFYIEMKDGKQSLPTKLWVSILEKAKEEGKIPMLIQHGKREKLMDARITLRLSDFIELTKLKQPEGTTINPPPKTTSEINYKNAMNKKGKVKS
ncbi:MAG: hypothetical protein KIS29_09880 [Thermoplasmata archaeon]|nr:hypothetical protein [Candidatus Sysuiplasma jiujiangense]